MKDIIIRANCESDLYNHYSGTPELSTDLREYIELKQRRISQHRKIRRQSRFHDSFYDRCLRNVGNGRCLDHPESEIKAEKTDAAPAPRQVHDRISLQRIKEVLKFFDRFVSGFLPILDRV